MAFKPFIDLEGFKVISSYDIEKFNCSKLESSVFQLGVILFPQDLINEKFLISIRNCMLGLNDKHPVKRWLTSQAFLEKKIKKDQVEIDFLIEILNSQFNLITDQKVKMSVIQVIGKIQEKTNLEKILKSYLYLMIGNITRSDNILKTIIAQTPRQFFQGLKDQRSTYHQITQDHLEKILRKMSRHPADRLTFYLLTLYLDEFTNDIDLLDLLDDIRPDKMKDKLGLSYTLSVSPAFVSYYRLLDMSEKRRMKNLRMKKYPFDMQSFWVWAFINIDPLISETMLERMKMMEKEDPLWLIYLLSDEKLSDMYFKNGGQPLSRRRLFLRGHLAVKEDFMMTAYKLIEIGDIDEGLVNSVTQYMLHE